MNTLHVVSFRILFVLRDIIFHESSPSMPTSVLSTWCIQHSSLCLYLEIWSAAELNEFLWHRRYRLKYHAPRRASEICLAPVNKATAGGGGVGVRHVCMYVCM